MKPFDLEMSLVNAVLAQFESKIHRDLKNILGLCELNCFKYFSNIYFGTKRPKNSDKKSFQLYQVSMHNFLCQNVPILPHCLLLMH